MGITSKHSTFQEVFACWLKSKASSVGYVAAALVFAPDNSCFWLLTAESSGKSTFAFTKGLSRNYESRVIIFSRIIMQIEELKQAKQKLYQIAAKYGISRVFVFGSVARGESVDVSDVDFLIEMDEGVSALGVGAFQYEVQKLLGTHIDVIPTFALQRVEDQEFVRSVEADLVAL